MTTESRRALEAVIMVADQPADPALLAQLVELSPAAVEEILEELAASYEAEQRGFRLMKVAGGWRYQSHEDCAPYVERYVLTGQTARLSAAALETLAIVAYKQPISRAQIAAIRGVGVDGVMRTLQQRGYVDETGRDPGPGQASLFGTTDVFLERLGLNSLDELPSLGDFVPGADVVELLEQGLRVEADEAAASGEVLATDDAESDAAEAESAETESAAAEDDGVTVDITDPVPLDLDAEDD
ncbi:MAG: SMC-Scp complex subunit ScpB [Actinomycetota bacterium]|nr:SMC-Scp complex subunit ScpB [Actinomycetota bacterium]